MKIPSTGSCACGGMQYECSAEPVFTGDYHCRDCQQATGGAYVPALAVPAAALGITGEVKHFDGKAENGNTVSRSFCPTCGARLFGKSSGMPELAVIFAGSLDDPGQFKPTMDIYTSRAQPWDHMNPALAKFPKLPQ